MNAWLSLKALVAQNPELVNIVSLGIGVIGLVLAYVFYRRAKPTRRIAFATRTFLVISERYTKVKGLEVRLGDRVVPALSVTRMAVWNSGTETVRGTDIATRDQLRISLAGSAEIISAKVLETSREAIQAGITSPPEGKSGHIIDFAFLDPGDGFLLELTHTSTSIKGVLLTGSLMGGRIIQTAADPEHTATAPPPGGPIVYTSESYRSLNLSLASAALIGSIVSAFVAIVAFMLDYADSSYFFAPASIFLMIVHFGVKAYVTRVYPPSKLRGFDENL